MELKFEYSLDTAPGRDSTINQTLFQIWKVTNNPNVSLSVRKDTADAVHAKQQSESLRRLNYRSWRLLQTGRQPREDVTHNIVSVLKVGKDEDLSNFNPSDKQFLSQKSSLFSDSTSDSSTKTTLFSHQSNRSTMDKLLEESDISDISEVEEGEVDEDDEDDDDDDEDDDDDDDIEIDEDEDDFYDSESEEEDEEDEKSHNHKEDVVRKPTQDATHALAVGGKSHLEAPASHLPKSPTPPPPLKRSTTSFVRGFSPSNVSISFNPNSQPIQTPKTTESAKDINTNSNNLLKRTPQDSQNIFYIANSPSPTDDADDATATTGGATATATDRSRSDSLFKSPPKEAIGRLTKSISHQSCSSTDISENENDNDSAWQSVSSDEEHDEVENLKNEMKEELVFNKRSINFPARASTDPTMSVSKYNSSQPSENINIEHNNINSSAVGNSANGSLTSSSYQPRSLLSGLFLNRMADNNKPSLKRSSTTDVFNKGSAQVPSISLLGNSLVEHRGENNRPSILFNKKHNSLVDIAQKRHSYSSEVNVTNETLPLAKKSSVVSISDFNVVTQATARSLSNNSSSTVNIIEEEGLSSPASNHDVETLSSSLNKYSVKRSGSSLSINGILSKSSMNLSGLFSGGNSSRVMSAASNSSNGSASHSSAKTGHGAENEIPTRRSLIMNGLFKKKDEQKSSKNAAEHSGNNENVKSDTAETLSNGAESGFSTENAAYTKANKTSNTSVDETYKNNVNEYIRNKGTHYTYNNNKGSKIDGTENANGGRENTNSGTVNSHGVVEPKYTANYSKIKSNLSAELSESLKDSIIIDYKLGKIALPQKVIENTLIEKPIAEDDNADDYHSKGW